MSADLHFYEICCRAVTADTASRLAGLYALMNADDPNFGEEPHFGRLYNEIRMWPPRELVLCHFATQILSGTTIVDNRELKWW